MQCICGVWIGCEYDWIQNFLHWFCLCPQLGKKHYALTWKPYGTKHALPHICLHRLTLGFPLPLCHRYLVSYRWSVGIFWIFISFGNLQSGDVKIQLATQLLGTGDLGSLWLCPWANLLSSLSGRSTFNAWTSDIFCLFLQTLWQMLKAAF